MPRITAGLVLLISGVQIAPVHATTWDVPGDAPTIQGGIDLASVGDTVLVAPGTYTGPGNRDLDLRGRDIVVRSSAGPASTVIDCQGTPQDVHRGFYIVGPNTEATVVEGFTIESGSTSGSALDSGGGIYLGSPSTTIRDCVITCNAVGEPPACAQAVVSDVTPASEASGVDMGGAIFGLGSSPRLEGCVISANVADVGNAINCLGGTLTITRSVVVGNGGGPLSGSGSGVISFGGDSLTITESTIAGNFGGPAISVGRAVVRVERSILWGNCDNSGQASEVVVGDSLGIVTFACSAVDSSAVEGPGQVVYVGENLFTDPFFCEPRTCGKAPTRFGDYGLRPDSPCLPAESPCGLLIGALGACDATSVPGPPGVQSLWVFPNPSLGVTHLRYSLPGDAPGRVTIFDAAGRRVREFEVTGRAGQITWDGPEAGGPDIGSGVYFLRLQSSGHSDTRRLVRIH